MKFQIKSSEFESAFGRILAASTISTKQELCVFCLNFRKGAVTLIGLGTDSYAEVELPAEEIEGKGRVALTPDILGLLKNRNEVVITCGTQIEIKQVKGRYTATLDAQPISSNFDDLVKRFTFTDGSNIDLTDEALAAIRKGVAGTSIKSVFEERPMLCYIVGAKNRLRISSFDNHHFGTFEAKVKVPTVRLAISSAHFALIERFAATRAITMNVMPDRILVKGEDFTLTLPGSQVEDENYLMAQNFLGELGDPSFSCTLNMADMQRTLGNLITLHKSNTYVSFGAVKNGLQLKFAGPSGTASEVIKAAEVSGKLAIDLEPRLLIDTTGLLGGAKDVSFSVYDNIVTFDTNGEDMRFVMACMLREQ